MNHPQPPETSPEPLAPGLRLPESERKAFSPEALAEIRDIMGQYPDKLAATLPALYIAQREFGFVSLAAMKAVAKALGIPEGNEVHAGLMLGRPQFRYTLAPPRKPLRVAWL